MPSSFLPCPISSSPKQQFSAILAIWGVSLGEKISHPMSEATSFPAWIPLSCPFHTNLSRPSAAQMSLPKSTTEQNLSQQDGNLPCSSEPKPWVVLPFFLHTPSNITSDASTETGGVPDFLLSHVSNNCVTKSGTETPGLAILAKSCHCAWMMLPTETSSQVVQELGPPHFTLCF